MNNVVPPSKKLSTSVAERSTKLAKSNHSPCPHTVISILMGPPPPVGNVKAPVDEPKPPKH